MSKTFEQHLTILEESLEDSPDPWFNNPKGWLRKPDYKRPAQERANVENHTAQSFSLANILNSGYKMRWFVLDIEKKRLVYYKNNQSGTPESGLVELKYIVDVQPSQVFDAPEFAIDLISNERHYTVVAADHNSMIRWAFAVNLILKSNSKPRAAPKAPAPAPKKPAGSSTVTEVSNVKWFRYDVIYEDAGPLMVNVMGLANRDRTGKVVNNWIIVTSFENHPDGRPGRSELSGMISVKDYMVGVNGLDLTTYTFNDAMDAIGAANWPKTIHFLRDNMATRDAVRVECWAFVYYPSLNRRRRRYIELRSDCINFRKPAPGGSASGKRDAYISIDKFAQIRPVIDKNLAQDQQFVLRIQCKGYAMVDLVDDDDVSLGGSPVDVLELCFAKQQQMNAWRSALASPSSSGDAAASIPILPIETIEAVTLATGAVGGKNAAMGIKSPLTGRFTVREFTISEGTLRWTRPSNKKTKSVSQAKERGVFIANSSNCGLHNCKAVIDPLEEKTGFKFQIILTTVDQTVTMGMGDEETMLRWLQVFRDTVAISPGDGAIIIPSSAEPISTSSSSRVVDDDYDVANDVEGSDNVVQGYLFKKGERVAPGIGSENFRKRWFVLKDFSLWYFKSASEARQSVILALGSMDLRSALEVREATGSDSPENGIEIVTPTRVYLLVAEDEDEQLRWLDALSDTLETRVMAIREGTDGAAMVTTSASDRISNKRKTVLFSGALKMRSMNRLTSAVTFKDRHFYIANGAITYYDYADDFFDEDKDCLGEISLLAISLIETSSDPRCQPQHAFDLHAHVLRGGDSNGNRVFTLCCKSANECREWMSEICTANGTLELRQKPGGGLRSAISETAIKEREKNRRKSSLLFANAATIQRVQATSDSSAGAEGGYKPSAAADDDTLTEEEAAKRKMAAMSARHRPSILQTGRGAGGRGGRGRSVADLGPMLAEANIRDESEYSSPAASASTAYASASASDSPPSSPPPPIPPLSPSASAEFQEEDPNDDVAATTVRFEGAVASSASSRKPHVLSTGGRGRGAGRGAAFQQASASRRGSNIANGDI